MRKVLVLLVGIAMLVGAGVAWSSHAPESSDPRDAVWGGGRFELVAGTTALIRDFSLSGKEGRFRGADGDFVYGRNGINQIRFEVQCVNVSGSHAVVAGTIYDAGNPEFVGLTASFWLIDNGGTASATRDQASGLFINAPEDLALLPEGYPEVCPSATTTALFFDVLYGDVVVHDAAD